MLTVFGVAAVSFMITMYALEARHRNFTLAFGCGCLLASAHGFASGARPFGVVERDPTGLDNSRHSSIIQVVT